MPRQRIPTAIKEAEGNPGRRPLNKNEPKAKGTLAAPKSLSKPALAIWMRVTASMTPGVYQSTDQTMLLLLCENVARFERASAAIAKTGEVSTGSQGQDIVSPWVRLQDTATSNIIKLCGRLGLDPVARQALTAPDTDDDDGWIVN